MIKRDCVISKLRLKVMLDEDDAWSVEKRRKSEAALAYSLSWKIKPNI